jgi:transcriptional regulator GlxA family with amidase domain
VRRPHLRLGPGAGRPVPAGADHGAAIANTVARRLVVPPHRAGGQAQFVTASVPPRDNHPLADLLPWARHFAAVTGTTRCNGC